VTVAVFEPEPLVCVMLQACVIVPVRVLEDCSLQVAEFEPDVETWTIVHDSDEEPELEPTDPPPPLALQTTLLTVPPIVENWRTRCDLVQVQPLPGHLGPA